MNNAFMTDTDIDDDYYYYFTTFSCSFSTSAKYIWIYMSTMDHLRRKKSL